MTHITDTTREQIAELLHNCSLKDLDFAEGIIDHRRFIANQKQQQKPGGNNNE